MNANGKIQIIFFSAYFCFNALYAQTIILANSALHGTLSKTSSPYYIKGNIYVPKDSTLIIEAGVQMRFDGKYQMSVYGKIKALGAEGDTIWFYPLDTNNRWKGIRFYGQGKISDSAIFKYCKFEGAGPKVTYFESCLYLTQGHFRVNHCFFTNNNGVIFSNSLRADSVLSLIVNDCYFFRNKNINKNLSVLYGVGGTMGISKGKVINCKFVENVSRNPLYGQDEYEVNGFGSGGTLIVFDVNQPNSSAEVNSCTFLRNSCGLQGAGIGIGYLKSSKLLVKNCEFRENNTGRYGAVTFLGNNNSIKGYLKITIDSCSFIGNTAANTTTGPGDAAALCVAAFSSYDSLIVKNCVFSKNVSFFNCLIFGNQNEKNLFLINNTFKNNYSGCVNSRVNSQLYSIGNKYYNNLWGNYIVVKSVDNQFYSINDLYAFNGFNTDTLKLAQIWKKKYDGLNFMNAEPGSANDATVGSVYRNCIFWGNRFYGGKLNHLVSYGTKFQEVSNCIFQGHVDSTVTVSCDTCHYPYKYNIKNRSNLYYNNPVFIKPPSDFGPDANTDSVDFRLVNTCTQLSPAYNSGINSAMADWTNYSDFDGKPRINCDTIDIGPYEIPSQFHRVNILKEPRDSSYCDNEMSISLSTTCNPNPAFTWQKIQGSLWSTIANSQSSTYYSNKPKSGTYRAIYTQTNCQIADTSLPFNIFLKPSPKPYLGIDTTIEQKASLLLNAGNFSSFLWQDNSTAQTYSVSGNTQGINKKTYWVQVGSNNGCWGRDSINITVTWNSAVQSLYKQGWNIYPNPTKDIINITNADYQAYKWTLYNTMGQLLFHGNESNVINLSTVPQGVYLIRIQSDGIDETIQVSKLE
jgi:hypothetical protein